MRRPRFGDPLPQTLRDHSGAVIFGGPMSANDADEFIGREIDWISVPLKEDKPFLGICLGAQMCTRALGGRVFPHPAGHAEIGYYPIRPTAAGLPSSIRGRNRSTNGTVKASICQTVPSFWPRATCSRCRPSVMGGVMRCNFIPTSRSLMMHKWTTLGHLRLELPGARPRAAHFADREVYDYSARAWLNFRSWRIGGSVRRDGTVCGAADYWPPASCCAK